MTLWPRFRVHRIDINTGKVRYGVAKHFLNNFTGINKLENVEVQLIEEVKEGNYDLEGKLWSRQKYWQTQLFTGCPLLLEKLEKLEKCLFSKIFLEKLESNILLSKMKLEKLEKYFLVLLFFLPCKKLSLVLIFSIFLLFCVCWAIGN